MASLRYSAGEESEDTLNSSHSFTGYEPNLLTFGELNDSSVPFSFMIPSTDQDVDDLTLGKMLTEAYRGQVEYCVPGGMSVSQSSSSSSVMFDGSGQLDGERMVDRSGQPDERNSSNAQIRSLLEEQRQTIISKKSVITNSKQLTQKKSVDSYKDSYGDRNWNFEKLINKVF